MKYKLIFLSLTLLFTSFLVEAQSQRGVRIGYIDMEYILENVPEYQEASIQLEGRVQKWKKDIETMQREIDQMKLNLSNERVLLTNELIEEREEDIKIEEDRLFEYQQDRFGPNGDLVIQKRQLVQPIQDQVFTAVQEIAGNRQYDFIFDKSADVVMLYAAERNDISDQVIRIINRAAKRTQAENRQDKREIESRDAMSDEQDKALTEREQAIEDRKSQREALLEERRRVRDSIRAARQAEFEARRQRILDERNQGDGDSNEDGDKNTSDPETEVDGKSNTTASNNDTPSREEIQAERKRVQDSIRAARVAEQEARRLQILEERERRRDSILNARNNNNTPPQQSEDDDDGGGSL
ncbi:OmpH family outer membrane protein [Planktosalinus lacus]|uniref:Membrane protein n=1 Tax=Planktosalinus lacus TaxID=1526573 RepID=A0A8J2Y8E1_9FLAO|nr:OmpH family outer membrane protein [Planktosalinus lacus]GGE01774.1 membrane protein [Planktosalinus lacus]